MQGLITSPNALKCYQFLEITETAPEKAVGIAHGFKGQKLKKALNHLYRANLAFLLTLNKQFYWTLNARVGDLVTFTTRAWFLARVSEIGGTGTKTQIILPNEKEYEYIVRGNQVYFSTYKCFLQDLKTKPLKECLITD